MLQPKEKNIPIPYSLFCPPKKILIMIPLSVFPKTKVLVLGLTIIENIFAMFVKEQIIAQRPVEKPIEVVLKATWHKNLV